MNNPKVLLMIDWNTLKPCHLADHLRDNGLECDVVGTDFSLNKWGPLKKIYSHWIPCLKVSCEAFRKRKSYDFIISWQQITGMFYSFFKLITFSKRPQLIILKVDIVERKNIFFNFIRKLVVKVVWKGADILGFYSKKQLQLIEKKYNMPSERAVVLPFSLHTEKFQSSEKLDLDGYIFSMGISYRDYDTLFKAAENIDKQFVVVTQDFVLERLKIPSNVKVYTNTFGSKASNLMKKASCVVITMQDPESPSGNTTMFEAMCYGKPVIITRAITTEEYIEDRKDGLLIPWKDSNALTEAVNYIFENPERAKQIGNAARESIKNKYSLDIYASKVAKIVKDKLAE